MVHGLYNYYICLSTPTENLGGKMFYMVHALIFIRPNENTTSDSFIGYNSHLLHNKNEIVKMTNVLVSTTVRNSGICNLTSHVDYYDCMVTSIEQYIAYI